MPQVSICIPCYNASAFISQAIESALAQTFSDFEIVVVDDGSTDDTVEMAKSFARRDARIRIHQNSDNLGIPRNWDRCRDLAVGEWVMFLFQDDLFRPDCAERMVRAAIQYSAKVVCCRRNFAFGPEVTEKHREDFLEKIEQGNFAAYFPNRSWVSPGDFCAQLAATPTVNFVGEPTAVLLHRSTSELFGKFHKTLIQYVDLEYWARIAVQAGIAYVDEPLITFRIHGQSSSSRNECAALRIDRLDRIIMLHDFLYSPAYASLRKSLKNRGKLYRHYAQQVAWLKQGPSESDPSRPTWECALDHYPELNNIDLVTSAVVSTHALARRLRKLLLNESRKLVA